VEDKNVLNYKKPKFCGFVILIIVVIAVGIGLIANSWRYMFKNRMDKGSVWNYCLYA